MHSASEEVRAAIVAAGGAIRFDEFMRIALYGDLSSIDITSSAGLRGNGMGFRASTLREVPLVGRGLSDRRAV